MTRLILCVAEEVVTRSVIQVTLVDQLRGYARCAKLELAFWKFQFELYLSVCS